MQADQEQKILAYLGGEMDERERCAFEKRLAGDARLREELEQWRSALEAVREWTEAPPPGLERVARLAIPTLPRPARVIDVAVRRRLWQLAAAAAIFLAGFWLGALRSSRSPVASSQTTLQTQTVVPAPTATPEASEPEQSAPASETADAVEAPPAEVTPPHYAAEKDGRVLVETTLKRSGGRATWVVDGQFQLAQTSEKKR